MQSQSHQPDPLSAILDDFAAAGIAPTPLAIISTATDRGLTDREISIIVNALASRPDLTASAA